MLHLCSFCNRRSINSQLTMMTLDMTKRRRSNLVTIRSLCRGQRAVYCAKLSGGDMSRCSSKTESVGLRKCPF